MWSVHSCRTAQTGYASAAELDDIIEDDGDDGSFDEPPLASPIVPESFFDTDSVLSLT